jgi:uncharacterized protein
VFIDIHVHMHPYPPPNRLNGNPVYPTPDQLIERFDEIGIERGAIMVRANPECAYVIQSNEEMIDAARRYDRFIPFCNIDPRSITNTSDAPLGDLLRHYRDMGCRGIGEVCPNMPFTDDFARNLFHHVQEVDLPLTFHIAPAIGGYYGLYDDPGLPLLERTLQDFPNLTFLGHSQPFWAEIGTLRVPDDRKEYPSYPVDEEGVIPRLMREYPNLHGDLSAGSGCNALARDEDYAAKFLDEFQDRLLFGTDICAPDTPAPLVGLLTRFRDEGRISETVFRKIARENAIRVLRLQA